MKFLMYLLVIASAINCGSTKQDQPKQSETEKSETSKVATQDPQVVVGKLTKDDLLQEPHASWFSAMYDSYKPEPAALEKIKNNINEYDIKIFMGTWCGDSKREVPKLLQLADLSDYNMENLEIYGVTRNKTMPDDHQKSFEIHHVPTIIFFKDGKEVNRFVEYPQQSFEEDIAAIVAGEGYKNSYE